MIDVRPWIFAAATLALATVSRASLLRPRTHGFYRFFAWECILALVLVNAPAWFRHSLSWNQLVSWILLCTSLVPLVLGVLALRRGGAADAARRSEAGLLAFERTTQLVTSGVFHYIRHPLYTSLLLLTWGAALKVLSVASVGLALAATALLAATARWDEIECSQVFGREYQTYRRATKMFIPYII